jgi:hypothetical protein
MSICPRTGISVPECSCQRCLEAMLRRVLPELLAGDVRVGRSLGAAEQHQAGRRAA